MQIGDKQSKQPTTRASSNESNQRPTAPSSSAPTGNHPQGQHSVTPARSSASSFYGEPLSKRPRRQSRTYNSCASCREAESHLRLSYALNSTGSSELAPLHFCNGGRPACSRCQMEGKTDCVYSTTLPEAIDRQDLLYKVECQTQDFSQVLFLLRVLHHGTDEEASLTLARLRVGEDIGNLTASLRSMTGTPVGK